MFDLSGAHIAILLAVVLLLFGSTRLPGAAKALGSSMHIFKKSLKEGGDEAKADAQTAVLPAAVPQSQLIQQAQQAQQAQPNATQQQLQDLQRQIQDLQRQTGDTAPAPNSPVASESPSTQQPS